MHTEEIRAQIKEIISNVTSIAPEDISDQASFRDDLDLDSLSLLEIGVDMDYEFKLGLPEEELQNLATLPEAVALVERRLHEKAAEVA
jgi:acyl carrier protein